MKRAAVLALTTCAMVSPFPAQDKVNPPSAVLEDFHRRVADYVKVGKSVEGSLGRSKPTNSSGQIEREQRRLAAGIREARRGAHPGDLFTPPIAAEFRRLIKFAMEGPDAEAIRKSLKHSEPVHPGAIQVNDEYPPGFPLQSTPPSLLLNLPMLPPELDYRVAGHNLVLRDTKANLIVDFIPDAIPG